MAIDPSIAAGQAPQNPMQFMQGLTALKGQQLQQNQLTQQINANQATSQAMQQAYDPATGRIDTNKLTAIMSQDHNAAYNLLPTQNAILENQNKQQTFDAGQFDLAKKRNDFFTTQLAGVMNNPNPTPEDLLNIGVSAVKQQHMPADQVVQLLQQAPSDPAAIHQWAQQHLQQAMINANQFAGVLPQNSQINTGPNTQFVSTDSITGRPSVQGQLQNGMAPGDANSMVPTYQNGQQGVTTKQNAANVINGTLQGQQPGQGDGSSLGLPGTGNNGRYPGQQQMPGVPSGQTPGFLPTAAPQGSEAAANVAATASANNANNLASQAEGSPQRVMYLQNMAQDLNGFTGGPNADQVKNLLSTIQEFAPGMAAAAGIDPNRITSQEQFNKYAINLATQATKGLGGGTDAQLAATVSGNPHAELTNLSNAQIIQMWLGSERATQAKNMAWQQAQQQPTASGRQLGPQDYNNWSTQWNGAVDPRVFVTPEMSQEARAKMYNGLNPADQQRFMQSYRTAIQSGIIQRPAQQ